MSSVLWDTKEEMPWQEALEGYSETLKTFASQSAIREDLVSLDHWVYDTLPNDVATRDPQQISQKELSKIMRWKLMKGKWRPRLQAFVDSLTEDEVIHASRTAFASLRSSETISSDAIRAAMNALTQLKGVGPATASAVLMLADPSLPFMSDGALEAAVTRKYTLPTYLTLREALVAKAEELSAKRNAKNWSARKVEHALWSAACARSADIGGISARKKRQRAADSGQTPSKRACSARGKGKSETGAEK